MTWVNDVIQGIMLGGFYGMLACGLALMFGLMTPAAVGVAELAGPFVRLAVAQQFQAQTIVILPLAVVAGPAIGKAVSNAVAASGEH